LARFLARFDPMTAIPTTPMSATPTGFSLTCVSFVDALRAYRRRSGPSLGLPLPPRLGG
jgi:hypothetical protein